MSRGSWGRIGSVLLGLLLLTLSPVRRAGAAESEPRVAIAPPPSWVTPLAPSHNEVAAAGGVALLLADFQARHVAGEHWRFVRMVLKVTSEIGIPDAGRREFSFVPPAERLVIHELTVRRAGEARSELRPGAIQVLRREAGLEQNVYDGRRTAVIVLPDVRVGDEIACAYSVIGQNPVLADHVAGNWQLGPGPAGALRYRVLSDKPLFTRAYAGAPEPVLHPGGLREYSLEQRDVAALPHEDRLPPGVDPYPWVELSDFESWPEVAAWARRLFVVPSTPGPRVSEVLRHLMDGHELRNEHELQAVETAAVVRYVQDKVRYFSMALAQSTHRPEAPETVLARGFGDCKDKALLAVTLLRTLGIDAEIALVDSSGGQGLPGRLPSASLFDHVIVSVLLDGTRFYLDPTRLYQRGTLEDIAVHDFGYALLLDSGQETLAPVPLPESQPTDIDATLEYSVERMGGPVRLETKTVFRRRHADAVRAMKASYSLADLGKTVAAPVLKIYPRAKLLGDVALEDDEDRDEFVLRQNFDLSEVWTTLADGRPALGIFPVWLSGQLPTIAMDRRAPIAVDYPLKIQHDITVTLPLGVRYADDKLEQTLPEYRFAYSSGQLGHSLNIVYSFATEADRIEADAFRSYRTELSKTERALDLSIMAPLPIPPAKVAWLWALLAAWVLLVSAFVLYVQKRQPYLRRPHIAYWPHLRGRRGLLALLGLGVSIVPFSSASWLFDLCKLLTPTTWSALTEPAGSRGYSPVLLTLEVMSQIVLTIGYCYVAYLYWARRRSFPVAFVAVHGFGIAITLIEQVSPVKADHVGGLALFRATLVPAVWCLYVLNSRRVKATFLPDPDLEEAASTAAHAA